MIKEIKYMKHGSEITIRHMFGAPHWVVKTCSKTDRYLSLARCRAWANKIAALNLGGVNHG